VTTQKVVYIKEDYAKDIQYVHATGEPDQGEKKQPSKAMA
jgi:hypothetical protein